MTRQPGTQSNFFLQLEKLRTFVGPTVFSLYIAALTVGLMTFLVEVSFVYVLQGFLVSIELLPLQQTFLPSWYPQGILASSVIFCAFGFTRAFAAFLRFYLTGMTSQAFVRHQRTKILEYAIVNSSELSTHEVTTAFRERIDSASYVLNKLSDLTIIFTSALCLGFFGMRLAPIELLLGVSLLFILILPLKRFNKTIAGIGERQNRTSMEINATLLVALKNNFFLKAHGLLNSEIERGTDLLKRFEQEHRVYYRIGGIRSVLPSLVGIFIVAAVSFVSIQFIHTPAMKLVSFFYIFVRLAQGASDAYGSIGEVLLNRVAIQTIYHWNSLLDAQRLKRPRPATPSHERGHQKLEEVTLEARQISFSYKSEDFLFTNLNFSVRPGEVLLIRGPSGVGKSSLLGILMGVSIPKTGEMILNGQALEPQIEILQNSLSYVGPEPFLKPGTLRENLVYGHPNPDSVTDEDLYQALSLTHMADHARALPGQLDHYLYELTQLSTGQKQRLSLSRALLRKPRLLILDEATANLDLDTELDVIQSLSPLFQSMTVIIVSHKETFNNLATTALVLGNKNSISTGTLAQ